MPSPANPHRSSFRGESAKSTPARTKPLDLGPQWGPYDTNTVRSKIRKWQQQGGGVVTANDTYYDDEDNAPPTRPKSNPTKESLGSKRSNKHASAAGVRKRSSSTPRKRVISDEHWRISRSTTQTPTPKRPSPNKISVYTSNDGLHPPREDRGDRGKDDKKDEKSRPTRSPRSVERARASRTSPLASRGRNKSKPWRTVGEKIEEEDAPQQAATGKSEVSEASEWDEDMRGTVQPTHDSEWVASEADFLELSRKRERGADDKQRDQGNPPKGGLFANMLRESRMLLEKSEPRKPAAPQREERLETWLSGTYDPCLVEDELSAEIPAPLNPKSTKPRHEAAGHEKVPDPKSSPDGSNHRQKRRISRRGADKEDSPVAKRERSAPAKKPSEGRQKGTSSPPSENKRSEHESYNPLTEAKEKDTTCGTGAVQNVASDAETHTFSDGSEVSENNPPVPLGRLRPFPSTGIHQLSTILSVDTLRSSDCGNPQASPHTSSEKRVPTTNSGMAAAISEERDQFDADSLSRVSSKLKRRLATHDDLMSVLSDSNSGRSIRSARSVRVNKSRLGATSMSDLLQELFTDETKYMRELKTLVGGVIPVLLTCVLSRSDSAVAAGLFRPSADPRDDVNFTKPIVDMGITLERLKTLHKRIPQENADSLLHWAQGAQRVYRDYLKAWRLGFKDVVVNLAPQEEDGEAPKDSDTRSLDEGMERDENGDVVGSDGEKVDVAYLLKRPLVRLKYLAKSLRGISTLQPSAKTEEIAMAYQDLVAEARRRAREERARLEDESAASVDATRARDPMTMAVLTDVTVDRSRRVRARDFFNLSLYHSSGQAVDCRVEFLLRDNIPENGPGGDLLICEVDHAERWLLFPPIDLGCVSARNGDTKGEIVVMLRSSPGQAKSWQELLSLEIDEEGIGSEWVQMLGMSPIPPQICRSPSFINRTKQRPRDQHQPATNKDASPGQKFPASPSDVDVPMGEKKAKSGSESGSSTKQPTSIGSSPAAGSRDSLQTAITKPLDYTKRGQPPLPSVFSFNSSGEEKTPTLKRSKAKRISRLAELSSPQGQSSPVPGASDKEKALPSTARSYYDEPKHFEQSTVPVSKSKTPPKERRPSKPIVEEDTYDSHSQPSRVSSVPSMELPIIPKLRDGSSSSLLPESSSDLSDEDDGPYDVSDEGELDIPPDAEEAPAPPPHRSPSSAGQDHLDVTTGAGRIKRHGSSPLKHEYEPSTASDSYDSDGSTVRHYDLDDSSSYLTTDYSETGSESDPESCSDFDDDDTSSLPGTDDPVSSLSPTKSVSQGAYRTVPIQPSKSSKAVASVFAWSDTGTWTNLFPGDCSVSVSPGLIEAYEMGSNANLPKDNKDQPLVALELTPLVPIRRGTAIDISIRSPPTQRSKVLSSNNIMFRSRNAEECDDLYCLINQARINNPTYIALQNARGPFDDQPATFDTPDNKSGGLFGWPRRRKSYRASPGSPRSTADVSESSVGTMSSAFSALKRFGAGNKIFNIARSTVTSKNGGKGGSSYSGSGGSGSTPSPSSGIGRIAAAIRGADGIGLSNAKIRLYARESHSKWRDMGAARLTILPGPSRSSDSSRPGTVMSGRSDHLADAFDSGSRSVSGPSTPRQGSGPTKRILVCGKTRGEVLLDVCLGEGSFERVARTGIAVSVWEENEGGAPAKQQGGVTVGAYRIYMIQMKSEAEAAYTFGLVGKLKY